MTTERIPRWTGVAIWSAILLLLLVALVSAVMRAATDVPHLVEGTQPSAESFEARYVRHPITAYTHLVPGVLYLLGALFQLSRRFRTGHLDLHRKMGRVVLVLGLVSGVFGLGFGIFLSFGGGGQALASAVFGSWFVASLVLAYRAIRSGRVDQHRRWMIRAFAVGLGVGTIRLWIGLLIALGVPEQAAFAPGFWLGFGMHVAAAELWLRWRPTVPS